MTNKPYKTPKHNPITVSEPATVYRRRSVTAEISSSDKWNPNIPVHGTQEEWRDHFHRIEEGHFMTLEEYKKKFAAWKEEYLANRLK